MSPVLIIPLAIAIVAYVIGKQLIGEAVQGKRLIVLPLVLTGIGVANVAGAHSHPSGTDIVLIAVSAAIAIAVGLGLGSLMRLESRDGGLWAQLPTRGLWLWGGLLVSRVALMGVAHVAGADVAASSDAILLTLGLNRVAQGCVVGGRAMLVGIPFAPEKDGSVFGANAAGGGPISNLIGAAARHGQTR